MSSEGRMLTGYLGPSGTFSEEAARRYGKGELVARRSIRELVTDVARGVLDLAVVPAENSIEGSVSETLDLLVGSDGIQIIGEIVIPIVHNLMAYPGTKIADIEEVLSHPQALAQCRNYLSANLPEALLRATNSTAEAAEEVKARQGRSPVAAVVGPARAGELYGLLTLAEGIQDFPENRTRFLVLSGKPSSARTGADKTSLVFSAKDRPGALCAILEEFAVRNINLTKIESRPSKRMLGEYVFFIDLEGHVEDAIVTEALEAVGAKSSFLKILGSYPKWQESGDRS